jgi:four helix bundle protein
MRYVLLPSIMPCQIIHRRDIRWRRCLANNCCALGTSVGANYAEAIRSHSLLDKAAKQQICIKELEETAYWLRLLVKTELVSAVRLDALFAETNELTAIFVASVRKLHEKG